MKRNYIMVVISDIHFGALPVEDLYNQLQEVYIKYLKELPVLDVVVINGDLYDNIISHNSREASYVMMFMHRVVKICKQKGAKVRAIKGTQTHDRNQLDNFLFYQNDTDIDFKVINTVRSEYLFDNLKVLYIPEEYMDNQEEYYKEYFDDEYNLILGHGMFEETSFIHQESEVQMSKAPIFDSKKLSSICNGPIIFGHIHIRTKIRNKVFYCGSYSRFRHGEEGPKGFILTVLSPDSDKFALTYVDNYLAKKYVTLNVTKEILAITNEGIESFVNDIDEYAKNIDYLRIDVDEYTQNDVFKIDFVKKYFLRNKNININIKAKIVSKEEEQEETQVEKYNYIFDKNISEEEKLQKFIKDKFDYDIDESRITELLNSKDIYKLLTD